MVDVYCSCGWKEQEPSKTGENKMMFTTADLKSIDTLKKAYHKYACLYHPDHQGDQEKMIELNIAFEKAVKSFKASSSNIKNVSKSFDAETYVKQYWNDNGWKGDLYDHKLSIKEIGKRVKQFCKIMFPFYKFSIRTKRDWNDVLYIRLKEADFDRNLKNKDFIETKNTVEEYVYRYNYNYSHYEFDDINVNFFVHFEFDNDYKNNTELKLTLNK